MKNPAKDKAADGSKKSDAVGNFGGSGNDTSAFGDSSSMWKKLLPIIGVLLLGWIGLNLFSGKDDADDAASTVAAAGDAAGDATDAASNAVDGATDAVAGAADAAGDAVSGVADAATDAASNAVDGATDAVAGAADAAGDAVSGVADALSLIHISEPTRPY